MLFSNLISTIFYLNPILLYLLTCLKCLIVVAAPILIVLLLAATLNPSLTIATSNCTSKLLSFITPYGPTYLPFFPYSIAPLL